jgi:hypothetical protein
MPYIIKSKIKNAQFNNHMKVVCVFQDEKLAMFYLNKLAEEDKLRVENDRLIRSAKKHDSDLVDRAPPREFFIKHYEFMDDKALLSSFEG